MSEMSETGNQAMFVFEVSSADFSALRCTEQMSHYVGYVPGALNDRLTAVVCLWPALQVKSAIRCSQ
jgi:hypothetical protein